MKKPDMQKDETVEKVGDALREGIWPPVAGLLLLGKLESLSYDFLTSPRKTFILSVPECSPHAEDVLDLKFVEV